MNAIKLRTCYVADPATGAKKSFSGRDAFFAAWCFAKQHEAEKVTVVESDGRETRTRVIIM